MKHDAIVVGAGPAGATAAIVMARAGLDVCLLEKDEFPRHKLCGEFVSNDGAEVLRGLQLGEALEGAGAVHIRRCMVSSPKGAFFEADLPGRPLSLSRYSLDALLMGEARRSGATVRSGCVVREVNGSLHDGFEVLASEDWLSSRTVVVACGRSSVLDRKLGLPDHDRPGDPLVAFKAHYEGPCVAETVELHAFGGGYCGIQPVERDRVNVCWITRASVLRAAGGRPDDMVDQVFAQNALLARRAAPLRRLSDTFLAVSQLNLKPRSALAGDVLLAGDTAGMIAPMCGDGMSMAMSSGYLLGRLVEAFLAGHLDEQRLKDQYTKSWSSLFLRRMRIGSLMHAGYEHAWVSDAGIRLCRRIPALGGWLIRATRS